MIERILRFRAGMRVKRFHTIDLVVGETVGHHSCNVAWIVTLLTPDPNSQLMQAALLHDVAEQWTGDVPATAKWASEGLSRELELYEEEMQALHNVDSIWLSQYDTRVLKQADMLDLCFKMVEELSMGNQQCAEILVRGITYLWENQPLESTKSILTKLEELCLTATSGK